MHRQTRRSWTAVVGAFVTGVLLAVVPGQEAESGGEFVALGEPVRLLDTRPGSSTVDGGFAGIGLRPARSTLELAVTGRAGLPADASSVVLNVTAVDALGWGYLTVHPSGTVRPNASNLNYDAGRTVANTVITSVGGGGGVSIFTHAGTHLLVDAVGYLPTDAFNALPASARLLDTRPGTATVDGQFAGIGRRAAGSTLQLEVGGRAGIPADATAVVLNVTSAVPDAWGYVTVHPSGTARPNTSNLNYDVGQTIANTVVTKLGIDGRASIYTDAAAHLIVDVAGHLPATSFEPLPAPARILDTRLGAGTVDEQQSAIGLRCASSSVRVHVAGRAGLPADASSVVLNVTAVDALGWGYVTEFPTGAARPNASNLNYDTGTTIANTVVARLGAGGDVCVYTYGATHLVVDVIGHLPGPPPPPDGPACPPMAYGAHRLLGGATVSDINDAGIIVGTDYHGSAGFSDAVWWPSLDGGPQLVPGVPTDVRSSTAVAINNRDQVLVSTYSSVTGTHLLVIDLPSGHATEFPVLEGLEVSAIALNDRGEVVVGVYEEGGCRGQLSCLELGGDAVVIWDSTTGLVETHPELTSNAYPRDINDLGHVVGESAGDAFFWDRDTDVVHRLDPGGFSRASARGVNDRGQVVGRVAGIDGGGSVFWSHRAAAPTPLRGDSSSVRDINEAGLAVGIDYGQTGTTSWVWDPASGRSIEFPTSPGAWIAAINDVGQIVGGVGHEQTAFWHPT